MKKKSSFFSDFKAFISKGNVIDLAVGVIVGGAFGKITTSLVNDIINPVVGLFTNTKDLSEWTITLREAIGETPAVEMKIGSFCATILDFVIIALSIFCVLRVLMHMRNATDSIKKKLTDSEEEAKEENEETK